MIVEANLFLIVFLVQDLNFFICLPNLTMLLLFNPVSYMIGKELAGGDVLALASWATLAAHSTTLLKLAGVTVSVLPSIYFVGALSGFQIYAGSSH